MLVSVQNKHIFILLMFTSRAHRCVEVYEGKQHLQVLLKSIDEFKVK